MAYSNMKTILFNPLAVAKPLCMSHARLVGQKAQLPLYIEARRCVPCAKCTLFYFYSSYVLSSTFRSGFTPLHYAARHGRPFVTQQICLLHEILANGDHLSFINARDFMYDQLAHSRTAVRMSGI